METSMGNAVEHMDDRILRDKVGFGKPPIALLVMSDSIELDNKVIHYEDLASWINQLDKTSIRGNTATRKLRAVNFVACCAHCLCCAAILPRKTL